MRVIDTLDITKLDPATLQLGFMSFGNRRVEVRRGLKNFTTDVDLRPGNNLIVRIVATLNETNGVLTWVFTSLDPATMLPTLDPLAGFLPPNATAPEGEGSVFFTIMPRAGLATHTAVRNRACIYFDTNAVICTPTWLNRVDDVAPVSRVQPLAAQQPSRSFAVSWSGTDAGSGIADYTVYASVNGRGYRPWLTHTRRTSAIFTGKLDSTYRFYSIARDTASNVELAPAGPDASTTINTLLVQSGANDTVCVGAAPYQLSGFSPAGGTWTGRGVTATGMVTPSRLLVGSNELVYTVTVGGQSLIAAKSVLVRPLPRTPAIIRVGADSLFASVFGASYEWRVNNTLLPVTTRMIRIAQAGNYTVRIRSAASCYSAPSTALVLATAVARQQGAVRIYPNPTSQRFTIAGEQLGGVQVKILSVQVMDELGRLVYEKIANRSGSLELPAPSAGGLYTVRVFTDKGVAVHRLAVLP